MMHRGLARVAVAVGAAMIGAVIATASAAAEDTPSDYPHATLELPDGKPIVAKDFPTKGCDGIKGGAKQGIDGWVFDQPVQGAENFIYILGLIDDKQKPVVLGLDNEGGIVNFDAGPFVSNAQSLKAGKVDDNQAKSLAKAAASTDQGLANESGSSEAPSMPDTLPLPDGVAGGLTGKGGVWLQTPAGWSLAYGELIYDKAGADAPETFQLVSVCTASATTPSPTATAAPSKAPGTGGGSGSSLPVTGTNVAVLSGVGVLLVAVGGLLFVARRRRESTKFVA